MSRAKAPTFTDAQMLDWVLAHTGNIETDRDELGYIVTVYLTSGDPLSGGVSGSFVAFGSTLLKCVSEIMAGNGTRI